ncbi:MAG TPA: hypothetical protein VFJ85_15335 [Acidimicrobiales bacterium]|nr:hypothetical protein [Acidimicrobiales bacterium]
MARKAAAKKTAPRRAMSAEHKAALATGRDQGRAVRRYLEALEQHRPRRGRKRTRDSVERRLGVVQATVVEAAPLERVQLIQERMDLEAELAAMDAGAGVDLVELEEAFVASAADYGARRGISYAAWRDAGVAPSVLRRAGIARST